MDQSSQAAVGSGSKPAEWPAAAAAGQGAEGQVLKQQLAGASGQHSKADAAEKTAQQPSSSFDATADLQPTTSRCGFAGNRATTACQSKYSMDA
ncbi:hypothetical protein ABBQ38_014319 [Trebouxia sp. C0009 RCD-2024]